MMTTSLPMVDRYAWWTSLKHGGLLIAPAKLGEFFVEKIPPLPRYIEDRLRRDVNRVRDGEQGHINILLDTVLEDVLGLGKDGWIKGNYVDRSWAQKAITGELIKPRRVWLEPQGGVLPVFVADSDSGILTRLGIGKGRRTISRVIEWLRKANQKMALLTNGRQFRLIHAGVDYDAWCEWDIDLWFTIGQPGLQVEALRILLGKTAICPEKNNILSPLIAAIQASRQGQAELSNILGERVRLAVELLIKESFVVGTLETISNRDIYIAATRMIMRCVVILFAEARDLLPRNNPIYYSSYGIQGLREQLDRFAGGNATERLRNCYSAWPRLLGLFRLVYQGCYHEALPIPRYGGGLFTPGNPDAKDPLLRAIAVFENLVHTPSDAVIYRILELLTRSKVKVSQGRSTIWVEAPVDFSDLSSEYIGILYESLLDYELRCAGKDDAIIFLNLGKQPALPLARLEAMDNHALANLVEKLKQPVKAETETTEEIEAEIEDIDEDLENVEVLTPKDEVLELDIDAVQQVRERALNWAMRTVEVGKLVAKPRSKKAEALTVYQEEVRKTANNLIVRVVLPGEWFLVRWGGTRKGSGTFYTRPQLAIPTTRRTLQPLVYDGEFPKKPAEILALKICDPAMGSGSFPVAALRFLTDALYESLHYHHCIEAHGDKTLCRLADGVGTNSMLAETLPLLPDADDFEEKLKGRLKRYIVERCIYGVDIDPLAVELARLSLWVETMDQTLPFSFIDHKLKCGNSLVGCWFDRFQDYPVMAWERKGGDIKHEKFIHHFREFVLKQGKKPGEFQQKGDKWHQAIKDTKNEKVKNELKTLLESLDPSKPQLEYPNFNLPSPPAAIHDQAQSIFEDLHRLPIDYLSEEQKENRYQQQFQENEAIKLLKLAFDSWCAVWFWSGEDMENAPTPVSFFNPSDVTRELIEKLAESYRFFHWELEFPDVFASSERPLPQPLSYEERGVNSPSFITSPSSFLAPPSLVGKGVGGLGHFQGSGFDAIIGNPPWEIQKPNSMEFFSNVDPLYRTYGKQEALNKQLEYFTNDPQIETAWLSYCDRMKALSNWTKNVGFPFGDPVEGKEKFSLSRSAKETEYLYELWRNKRHKQKGYAEPRHPFLYQGSADINTYKMFLELSIVLLHQDGQMGMIVPSGIYTDKGSTNLRTLFLSECQWQWLFGFENRDGIFNIHRSFKFCPIIVKKGGETEVIQATFMQRDLTTWEEAEKYVLAYPGVRVEQFSPKSKAILEIKSERDLQILEKMYANGVLLGDDSPQGWGIQYAREFDMTNDSKLFPPRPQWEAKGYCPDEYGHWLKGNWQVYEGTRSILHRSEGLILSADGSSAINIDEVEDVALPLYEGRMIGQFDFSQKGWVSGKGRTAVWRDIPWDNKVIEPQYLMSIKEIDAVGFLPKAGIMDIASSTNSRTMYATFLSSVPCGHSAPIIGLGDPNLIKILNLVSIYNSYSFDYLIRVRMGGLHLTWHYLEETTIPKKITNFNYNFVLASAKLSIAASKYAREWSHIYQKFISNISSVHWYQLWAITPYDRLRLRCILDAIVAELYGLEIEDFASILQDCDYPITQVCDKKFARTLDPKGFWRVDKEKDPELRHTVLSLVAFHELKHLGLENFLNLNNSEGWMLPQTLRLADYNLGQDDRAKEPQPVAQRLGDRFLPWQLESAIEESWQECERHADNLQRLLGTPKLPEPPSKLLPTDPNYQPPTDSFGNPLEIDLFGNIVPVKPKRKKR